MITLDWRGWGLSDRPFPSRPKVQHISSAAEYQLDLNVAIGLATEKKLIICVRPGVLLVFAKFRFPVKLLIALDLPAFDRPQKTTSDPESVGHSDNLVALVKN